MEAFATRGEADRGAAGAVDTRTGRVYTGHHRERRPLPDDLRQRLPEPEVEAWPADKCAEVSAVSNAMADGARLPDLVITAVLHSDRKVTKPCRNCKTWIPDGGAA